MRTTEKQDFASSEEFNALANNVSQGDYLDEPDAWKKEMVDEALDVARAEYRKMQESEDTDQDAWDNAEYNAYDTALEGRFEVESLNYINCVLATYQSIQDDKA